MSTNAPHHAAVPTAAAAVAAPPPTKPGAKKAGLAIDALTATLQASKLAEAGAAAFAQLSAAAIKQRLLHPQVAPAPEAERIPEQGEVEEDEAAYRVAPALSTYIHDRVWAEGGEFVLRIASTPDEGVTFSAAELDAALANVAEAAKEVECQTTNLIVVHHDTDSSADVMLRRTPNGAQELLELRVAVVGNGE